MVHQDDEDYDEQYDTPNASGIDETSFTVPDTTEVTSTLRLRQKVKRDKINALYRQLDVTGNPDLIDLDRFRLTTDSKKGAMIFGFYKSNNRVVPLTKQTGEFLAAKTLRDRLGGVNAMKIFLGTDKTPTVLERSFRAATKLKTEVPMDLEIEVIPLKDLSSLAEEIHVKNTNLDLREILDIDRALQSIQGELFNNTSKLTESISILREILKN